MRRVRTRVPNKPRVKQVGKVIVVALRVWRTICLLDSLLSCDNKNEPRAFGRHSVPHLQHNKL